MNITRRSFMIGGLAAVAASSVPLIGTGAVVKAAPVKPLRLIDPQAFLDLNSERVLRGVFVRSMVTEEAARGRIHNQFSYFKFDAERALCDDDSVRVDFNIIPEGSCCDGASAHFGPISMNGPYRWEPILPQGHRVHREAPVRVQQVLT